MAGAGARLFWPAGGALGGGAPIRSTAEVWTGGRIWKQVKQLKGKGLA